MTAILVSVVWLVQAYQITQNECVIGHVEQSCIYAKQHADTLMKLGYRLGPHEYWGKTP